MVYGYARVSTKGRADSHKAGSVREIGLTGKRTYH